MNILRKRIKLNHIINLITSIILSILIMTITVKLSNNLIVNHESLFYKNKTIIEKTLEHNAYNAQDELENLHDIKEGIDKFTENESNKFKNKMHKFHFENFLHFLD